MNLRWMALVSAILIAVLILALRPPRRAFESSGESLVLYCAAGMRPAVAAIISDYEKETGVRVEIEYAGSGALLSQIRAADKGDLYLPASQSYVEQAEAFDLIEERAQLATQRVVIAVRKDAKITDGVDSLEQLLETEARITLANPEVAAVGRAAKKMLEESGQWDSLWEKKLGTVDTVNLVANHVEVDFADAGIIWDSTASQYPTLRTIRVPAFEKYPKKIFIAVLKSSKQPTRALHLFRYIAARDRGLKHFASFCQEVAEGDVWEDQPDLLVFAGGLNRPAIEDTIDIFEAREGVSVTDSYNGCGALVGQMKGGSRPDLYFACDVTFMTQVDDLFPNSFEVSGTEMVIISRTDRSGSPIETLKDLSRDGLKVGVCSPVQSALGALTKQLLERNGLWEDVHRNVLDEPPTADVLVAKVVAGALDTAIVYKANTTRQLDKLTVTAIDDPGAHAIQPIAVATDSKHRQLAERLMNRILSAKSAAKFKSLGFEWRGAAGE